MDSADQAEAVAGPHSFACAGFLAGVAPLRSEGALKVGVSFDQKAARASERNTWLSSIELACEETRVSWSDREPGYSTAYLNHLSWRSEYTPMPAETDPKAAFDRLFQDGGRRWATDNLARSVLDRTRAGTQALAMKLGPADRSRLADYLTNVREIEQQAQVAYSLSKREKALLMMDIVALAFQTNTTRVATIMLGREKSSSTFPELSIPETHHQLSHRYRDQATVKKLSAIDRYHTGLFAHLVGRLESARTEQGSVLDSSILMYGSGLSDGSCHSHDNLPIVMAGGYYRPADCGKHIHFDNGRKLTDLQASITRSFIGEGRA
jgi:hypothetical protein